MLSMPVEIEALNSLQAVHQPANPETATALATQPPAGPRVLPARGEPTDPQVIDYHRRTRGTEPCDPPISLPYRKPGCPLAPPAPNGSYYFPSRPNRKSTNRAFRRQHTDPFRSSPLHTAAAQSIRLLSFRSCTPPRPRHCRRRTKRPTYLASFLLHTVPPPAVQRGCRRGLVATCGVVSTCHVVYRRRTGPLQYPYLADKSNGPRVRHQRTHLP